MFGCTEADIPNNNTNDDIDQNPQDGEDNTPPSTNTAPSETDIFTINLNKSDLEVDEYDLCKLIPIKWNSEDIDELESGRLQKYYAKKYHLLSRTELDIRISTNKMAVNNYCIIKNRDCYDTYCTEYVDRVGYQIKDHDTFRCIQPSDALPNIEPYTSTVIELGDTPAGQAILHYKEENKINDFPTTAYTFKKGNANGVMIPLPNEQFLSISDPIRDTPIEVAKTVYENYLSNKHLTNKKVIIEDKFFNKFNGVSFKKMTKSPSPILNIKLDKLYKGFSKDSKDISSYENDSEEHEQNQNWVFSQSYISNKSYISHTTNVDKYARVDETFGAGGVTIQIGDFLDQLLGGLGTYPDYINPDKYLIEENIDCLPEGYTKYSKYHVFECKTSTPTGFFRMGIDTENEITDEEIDLIKTQTKNFN